MVWIRISRPCSVPQNLSCNGGGGSVYPSICGTASLLFRHLLTVFVSIMSQHDVFSRISQFTYGTSFIIHLLCWTDTRKMIFISSISTYINVSISGFWGNYIYNKQHIQVSILYFTHCQLSVLALCLQIKVWSFSVLSIRKDSRSLLSS